MSFTIIFVCLVFIGCVVASDHVCHALKEIGNVLVQIKKDLKGVTPYDRELAREAYEISCNKLKTMLKEEMKYYVKSADLEKMLSGGTPVEVVKKPRGRKKKDDNSETTNV